MRHELVRLAGLIDWSFFDQRFEPLYAEKGRPGVPTRLMVGLHLLKHIHNLADEVVCDRWVENPYFSSSEKRRKARQELPQGTPRGPDQRHPDRRRTQVPPPPPVAQALIVPHPRRPDPARLNDTRSGCPRLITQDAGNGLYHGRLAGRERIKT